MGFPSGSDGKEFSAVQEIWVLSLGQEDSPEKGISTHSSTPAWRIPWTVEPGELHGSMGHKEFDMTEQLTLSHFMTDNINFVVKYFLNWHNFSCLFYFIIFLTKLYFAL